jgi:N-formylglutamate deformylase
MESAPFYIERPSGRRRPILVSVPHSGTEIPPELARGMRPELARTVPDTDFFVHELYGFAPELGITMIHARYSRFVIDLNRDPAGRKLYADGRAETALVPVTSFAQERLYQTPEDEPDEAEIARRVARYYEPYHQAVADELAALQREFPMGVLLWEAHSIRRHVPSVRPEPFPDLMLGDQQGKTAAAALTELALARLRAGGFDVGHNAPFMGGYLTRKFGRPGDRQHALQLEMAQDVYMQVAAMRRSPELQAKMQPTLRATLRALADALEGER